MRIAEPGKGGSTGSTVNEALKSVGLRYDDAVHVYNMGFPEMVTALEALDGADRLRPEFAIGGQSKLSLHLGHSRPVVGLHVKPVVIRN